MLIIDAYNVLHATGVLPPILAGLDLSGLCRLIGVSRYAARESLLICDGTPPRGLTREPRPERMQIRFSGPDREADDLIEELLEQARSGKTTIVVSSDRRIDRAARRRRMTVVSSDVFLRQLATDFARHEARNARPPATPSPRAAVPLTPELVRQWSRAFGVHGAEAVAELKELADRLQSRFTPARPNIGTSCSAPPQPASRSGARADKSKAPKPRPAPPTPARQASPPSVDELERRRHDELLRIAPHLHAESLGMESVLKRSPQPSVPAPAGRRGPRKRRR